jgi:flagellar hook-associated protein 3 FlgL
MRIATSQVYSLGADAISRAQTELFATQQRIASGQRMLNPADDPVGSAQAIVTAQSKNRVERFASNITTANEQLSFTESILGDVTDALTDLRTLAVSAGGGALSDADRASIATEIEGRLKSLVGLANSKAADGTYLFSGFKVDAQPFALVAGTYTYMGDQGQRELAVSDGRDMAVTENGSALFDAVVTGNGSFVTSAAAGNAGSGTIDVGSVYDTSRLTGHDYQLQFSVLAGSTTFNVVDLTAGGANVPPANRAYTSGSEIQFDGIQVAVSGAPANAAAFNVGSSTRQSVFTTIQNLVSALRVSGNTQAGKATIAGGISAALQNLTQASEAVLTTRAGVGARLAELESLSAGNDARSLQYDTQLSQLQDLDYNKAMSDFARQQLALEAAQKSFLSVSGLSLFKYL